MPKVEINRNRIVSRLIQEEWKLVRHGAEHDIYRKSGESRVISVPRHRELSPGVARQIARTAGWILKRTGVTA
jgi:predicted RNA binding protein YcfA (HicA-like mRNA interferase family)